MIVSGLSATSASIGQISNGLISWNGLVNIVNLIGFVDSGIISLVGQNSLIGLCLANLVAAMITSALLAVLGVLAAPAPLA
jgi:hypothetical protein